MIFQVESYGYWVRATFAASEVLDWVVTAPEPKAWRFPFPLGPLNESDPSTFYSREKYPPSCLSFFFLGSFFFLFFFCFIICFFLFFLHFFGPTLRVSSTHQGIQDTLTCGSCLIEIPAWFQHYHRFPSHRRYKPAFGRALPSPPTHPSGLAPSLLFQLDTLLFLPFSLSGGLQRDQDCGSQPNRVHSHRKDLRRTKHSSQQNHHWMFTNPYTRPKRLFVLAGEQLLIL